MPLTFHMHTDGFDSLKARLSVGCTRAERAVALQAAQDTEKYVPMRTGSLRQRTLVVGNQIIYPGPYARYLYYGKYMVDAATGAGPMHFRDKNNNEHIKYRKGAILKPTERDLVFHHPNTRSHWMDYSYARNKEKWKRIAAKAVKNEL